MKHRLTVLRDERGAVTAERAALAIGVVAAAAVIINAMRWMVEQHALVVRLLAWIVHLIQRMVP